MTYAAVGGAVAATMAIQTQKDLLHQDQVRIDHCKNVIGAFQAQTASTSQKQAYAECVQLLYPKESHATSHEILLSAMLVFALVAFYKLFR